jgi:hypothetical protein
MCNMKKKEIDAKALRMSTENLVTSGSTSELNESRNSSAMQGALDPETKKRITQLNSYISIEQKFAQGATAILKASTTENQKVTADNQLENFKKNIAEWQQELDEIMGDGDPLNASTTDKVSQYNLTDLDWERFRGSSLRTRPVRLEKRPRGLFEKENC